MRIISPKVSTSVRQGNVLLITLNKLFFPTDANISVKLESCTNEDFTGTVKQWVPTKILLEDRTSISTNGTVSNTHKNKKILIEDAFPTTGRQFVRVRVEQNSIVFHSNSIFVSSEIGSCTILSKTIKKDFLPRYISFHDNYELDGTESNITITVEATNNGLDTTPTWEDVTEEYLNGKPYQFKNKTKTNKDYGVAVRITVRKTDYFCTFNLYKMKFIVT